MSVDLQAWADRSTEPGVIRVRQLAGFGEHVRPVMRAVHQDMRWDGKDRVWVFPYAPASIYALAQAAEMLRLRLQLDPFLQQVQRAVLDANAREEQVRKLIQVHIDNPKLPVAPFTTLQNPPPYPHQQIAWHWSMRVPALYLAHKMGLGKTREGADIIRGKMEAGIIEWPEHYAVDAAASVVDPSRILPPQWCIRGGCLVVAPRASMLEWTEQLWRWQGIEALPIAGRSAEVKRQLAGTPAWVHVCSYDSLETVERNSYNMIIADEAHSIASGESNRFLRMMYLRWRARSVIALSGTPYPDGLESLWAQAYWLDGGRHLGPTREAFRKRFLAADLKEADGLTAEQRVARAISPIFWPLSMQQAFPDKPQKIHKAIRIPMTPEQASYYAKLRDETRAEVLTGKVTMTQAMTRIMKLMQVVQGFVLDDKRVVQKFSSAKLTALEEMFKPGGELTERRTIVWCRFRPELHMIEEMLKRRGIKHALLHGDISETKKQEMKHAWNNDHTYRVLVGMIQMGIGLNLHAPKCVDDEGRPARCSTTVFYGLDWRPTLLEQSMDRVYRSDQVESCLYLYMLSDDLDSSDGKSKPMKPIDVRIYESLLAKLDGAKVVDEESVEYIRSLLAA